MTKGPYPRLLIDTKKLQSNIQTMMKVCQDYGIVVSGVVKGTNGIPEIIENFIQAGMKHLASSRLCQLERIKKMDSSVHTLALRIPMLSELDELIEVADCSLNSEIETLTALNELCQRKNKHHEVVLMNDLGDLREGFFEQEELIQAAVYVENECPNLYLKGIGTNLGCYGSIEPDQENLGQLIENARIIEEQIGRSLDWISGGATTSVPLVLNKTMPKGINHLRIGDGIYLRDMELYFDYHFDQMHGDVFILEGEIIEIHNKPSHPIGTISVDAFGNRPVYEDIGRRDRALLAMGRQDIGDMTKLIPIDQNIVVKGGSSDHTIVDITESEKNYKLGDTIKFTLQYENLLLASSSEYIYKQYI
ncbi:alanine/ornithine racemase family PLP-dependent enzyme [Ignavigranum ruoffiae]